MKKRLLLLALALGLFAGGGLMYRELLSTLYFPILVSIAIIVVVQTIKGTFFRIENSEDDMPMAVARKLLVITIQVILFWIFWILIGDFFSFIEWAYTHQNIDFEIYKQRDFMEDSMAWGIFSILISFPLAFFIVKKLKLKF